MLQLCGSEGTSIGTCLGGLPRGVIKRGYYQGCLPNGVITKGVYQKGLLREVIIKFVYLSTPGKCHKRRRTLPRQCGNTRWSRRPDTPRGDDEH